MAGRLKQEIRQEKPFGSPEEEVILGMLRTADQLAVPMNEVLREAGLSLSQYNVLRILRGAGEDGLACGEISERMVRRDPDLTRLLDRMEANGFVTRARATNDRRVVLTRVTGKGLETLEKLDLSVAASVRQTLAHMPADRLNALTELLEEARGAKG